MNSLCLRGFIELPVATEERSTETEAQKESQFGGETKAIADFEGKVSSVCVVIVSTGTQDSMG